MEFLRASPGHHMSGGGSSTDRQSGSSFGAQGAGVAQVSCTDDILKWVEQLLVIAEQEKLLLGKKLKNSLIV